MARAIHVFRTPDRFIADRRDRRSGSRDCPRGHERRARKRPRQPDLPRHRPGQPPLHLALSGGPHSPLRDRQPRPGGLWNKVLERAEDAPAEIEPGLLASTLRDQGIRISARPLAGSPALIAVDAEGRVQRANGCDPGVCAG